MSKDNFVGDEKSAVDFLGNRYEFDCYGCAIVSGYMKVPGGIIYEGKHCILAADPEVPVPGFLIVNTKRHLTSISEMTLEERHELIDIVHHAEKAIKSLNISNEITIVQEERSSHLHVWIFPHQDWMNKKYGKGIPYLRTIFADVKENATKEDIKEVLDKLELIKNYFKDIDITK